MSSLRAVGLALVVAYGCASPAKTPPMAVVEPKSSGHEDTTSKPPGRAPPDTPAAETEPACVPRAPASDAVCDDARLTRLLAEYDKTERDLREGGGERPRCEMLAVEDLELAAIASGRLGAGDGYRFLGDQDLDGDGKADVVRLFTSVDYGAWLLFVREPRCLRFVDVVEGYQVEQLSSSHHGVHDLSVLTYPAGGHIERRHFDGTKFVP